MVIKLSERQRKFANNIVKTIRNRRNSLCVAPTGFGKTIIFTALLEYFFRTNQVKKICVLCHRDEINYQNKKCFESINPHITTGLFDGKHKDWDKQAIFAMFQTLGLNKNLLQLDAIDMLIIDEAHHASASSYQKIINYFRTKNSNFKLLGFTATPERGDGINLLDTFDNIADEITIKEAFEEGLLIELEEEHIILEDIDIKKKIANLNYKDGEYDMNQSERLINILPLNDEVVYNWKKYASDRQTIIFCTNLKHVNNLTEHFQRKGIKTEGLSEQTNFSKRKEILNSFRVGEIKIIINCNILIEGFDLSSVSCIMILRPVRFRTTFYQMIGRGLRRDKSSDAIKKKCLLICWGDKEIIDKHISYFWQEKKSNFIGKQNNNINKKNVKKNMNSNKRSSIQYTYTNRFVIKRTNNTQIKMQNKLKDSEFEWYEVFETAKNIKGFMTLGYFNIKCWILIVYLISQKECVVMSGTSDEDFNILMKDKDPLHCIIEAEKWLQNMDNKKSLYFKKRKTSIDINDNQLYHKKFPYLIRELYESGEIELTSFQGSILITVSSQRENIQKTLGIEEIELNIIKDIF
nr:DEAD/DEAH box helicase [Candidatus Phytoplasma sacchari]KAB8122755.1 DEAD/DEAH box helicase [Candidatus Phytoplasma sacchari]